MTPILVTMKLFFFSQRQLKNLCYILALSCKVTMVDLKSTPLQGPGLAGRAHATMVQGRQLCMHRTVQGSVGLASTKKAIAIEGSGGWLVHNLP